MQQIDMDNQNLQRQISVEREQYKILIQELQGKYDKVISDQMANKFKSNENHCSQIGELITQNTGSLEQELNILQDNKSDLEQKYSKMNECMQLLIKERQILKKQLDEYKSKESYQSQKSPFNKQNNNSYISNNMNIELPLQIIENIDILKQSSTNTLNNNTSSLSKIRQLNNQYASLNMQKNASQTSPTLQVPQKNKNNNQKFPVSPANKKTWISYFGALNPKENENKSPNTLKKSSICNLKEWKSLRSSSKKDKLQIPTDKSPPAQSREHMLSSQLIKQPNSSFRRDETSKGRKNEMYKNDKIVEINLKDEVLTENDISNNETINKNEGHFKKVNYSWKIKSLKGYQTDHLESNKKLKDQDDINSDQIQSELTLSFEEHHNKYYSNTEQNDQPIINNDTFLNKAKCQQRIEEQGRRIPSKTWSAHEIINLNEPKKGKYQFLQQINNINISIEALKQDQN